MALGLKGFAAVVEKGMKIALYLLIGAAGLFSTCQSAQPDYSEWVKEENYLNRCKAFKDEHLFNSCVEFSKKQVNEAIAQAMRAWQFSAEVDPVTDQKITIAYLNEEESDGSPVVLAVVCKGKDLSAMIDWRKTIDLTTDAHILTTRFDKGKSANYFWGLSGSVTKSNNPVKFVDELVDASRLVVRAYPSGGGVLTASFDVRGVKTAVQPVLAQCLL